MTSVLVVGATGQLGGQIVSSLQRRDAEVRALVRPASLTGDAARRLVDAGVGIVEGDVTGPVEQLARAVDGADVIVSAVQGGEDVVTHGQINLIRAAERAGVPRLIPSDFAFDLYRLDDGDNVFVDHRRRANTAFAGSPVRPTPVLSGAFVEVMTEPFLEIVDWTAGTFSYWGDGDQPCDFTTIPDTAEYTAAAAIDPATADRPVRVAGDVLTMAEFHAALEQGSGRTLRRRRLGGTDELWQEIQRRKAVASGPPEYVALQYVWAMVTGKAKLDPLENYRFGDIRPTTVTEYARRFAG